MVLTLTRFHGPVNIVHGGITQRFTTGRELLAHILTEATDSGQKGSAGYWVTCPLVGGVRADRNAQPTRVVALDWDGAPIDWQLLEPFRYIAHTTDSHTEEAPRWRVFLILDREYSREELTQAERPPWPGAYLRAASQPAFVPTRGDTIEWVDHSDTGRPYVLTPRVADQPPGAPSAPTTPSAARRPTLASTHALVARWLADPAGTNRLAGATGSVLAAWGWTDDAVGAWLRGLVGRADPKVEKHVNDAVRAAQTRRAGGTVPGLPTLETELGVPFEAVGAPSVWSTTSDALWAGVAPDDGPEVDQNGWVTAAAVAAWSPPPVAWLCEGIALAPGAPVLLSGYGGSGKTTLAQHLAVCVSSCSQGARARLPAADVPQGLVDPRRQDGAVPGEHALGGRKFLDVLEVEHGAVTHIDYEQGIELTARRYLDLGLTAESALRFRAPPTPTPGLGADAAGRAWLAEACVGQRLVLVDSFVAGLGAALEDENDARVREPLDWLRDVSLATGAVVVVIHHSRKTQRGGDARQTARGSSAITDAVSVHLSYERDGDSAVLRLAKLRRSPPAGLLAGLLGEGVRVTPELRLGGARTNGSGADLDAASSVSSAAVLDAVRELKSKHGGRSTSAVCRGLGRGTTSDEMRPVRATLETLALDGRVEKRTAGKHTTWWPLA